MVTFLEPQETELLVIPSLSQSFNRKSLGSSQLQYNIWETHDRLCGVASHNGEQTREDGESLPFHLQLGVFIIMADPRF